MGSNLENNKDTFFEIFKRNPEFKARALIASLFSILNKTFDLAPEILIGIAIDVVVSKKQSFLANLGVTDPWHQIITLAFLTFLIWLAESVFEYLLKIKWRHLAQDLQAHMRLQSYRHIQNLHLSYFEGAQTGKIVSTINDDINQLERFLDVGINQLLQTLVAVVGVGTVFFVISPPIALVAFLPIPIIIFGAFFFQQKAAPLYSKVRESAGLISSRLVNSISGIMTIKSYTAETYEANLLKIDSDNYAKANKEAIAVSSAFIPTIRMAILLGFLATFTYGGHKALSGELAIGSYGVLIFLTQRLLWPLTMLGESADLFERAMASAKRVFALLENPKESNSGSHSPEKLTGHFLGKNLAFSYENGYQVFKNLNFEIPAQKTVAFVGTTGSGKSTLTKLFLNFYQPQSGKLELDGAPITSFELSSLRSKISYVSQESFLFDGTIKDNILYGSQEASHAEMIEAAKTAEIYDFIMSLGEQFATLVGERGIRLSGGQKQRISIARAILKKPNIYIFDEATSAVDNETEAALKRSLEKISRGTTTILIAHRLSSIVNADIIYVIDKGEVKEQGTHQELIKKGTLYQHLWAVQTGDNSINNINQ